MSDHVDSGRTRLNHAALLLVILIAAGALRAYQYRGFGASDDAAYAEIAARIASGEPVIGAYDGPAVFPLRVGIIAPTAVLFRTFGVNEWTIAAFPFLMSLLGVVLAYACARHLFGPRAGLAAGAIWALLPIDAFHAGILAPDAAAAVSLGAAILVVLWLLRPEGATTGSRLFGGGLLAGVLLGVSWLTKETVAYAAPFFLFLIVKERARLRDVWVLWAGVAAASFSVLFLEALYYQAATGDWLYHFAETERNYQQYPRAFAVETLNRGDPGYERAVFKRLVYTGPWTILLNPRLGFLPLLGAVAGLHGLWRRDSRYLVPVAWLLTLGLMFNFSSSSTREYVPLVLFDRYLYPLLLPAAVLLAGFLTKPLERSVESHPDVRRERAFWSGATVVFVFLTFAFQNREYRSFSPDWTVESEIVAGMLDPAERVYTDAHSIFGLDFYWAYPEEMNAVNFEDLDDVSSIRPGEHVLVNLAYQSHLEAFSGWWPTQSNPYVRPDFVVEPPANWESVWSNGNGTLYEVRQAP